MSDAAGSMKTSLVAQSSPFKQEMLTPTECYILDNGVDSKIFLWKGMVKSFFAVLILHTLTISSVLTTQDLMQTLKNVRQP